MDSEIAAMAKMAEALEELDAPARTRVLRWAVDKYEVTMTHKKKEEEVPNEGDTDTPSDNAAGHQEYDSFAELFSDAGPTTAPEKVLVAGYWYQEVLGQIEVTSMELNKDLKDLGHGITGMNDRFASLMSSKPQLAIQLKKSGTTKQARKKYKITKAGLAKVQEMLGK